MNKKAGELTPGTFVLKPDTATKDWIELDNPALDLSPSGAWLSLCYVDGSRSRPMTPDTLIEARIPIGNSS